MCIYFCFAGQKEFSRQIITIFILIILSNFILQKNTTFAPQINFIKMDEGPICFLIIK